MKKLYGNTVCNLQNGGSIVKKNDMMYFVIRDGKRNKLASYN